MRSCACEHRPALLYSFGFNIYQSLLKIHNWHLEQGNRSQGYHIMKNTKAGRLTTAKLITLLPAPQICCFWLCCVVSFSREGRQGESLPWQSHLHSSGQEVANLLKGSSFHYYGLKHVYNHGYWLNAVTSMLQYKWWTEQLLRLTCWNLICYYMH